MSRQYDKVLDALIGLNKAKEKPDIEALDFLNAHWEVYGSFLEARLIQWNDASWVEIFEKFNLTLIKDKSEIKLVPITDATKVLYSDTKK